MKPLWHPLSAILLSDPPTFAPPFLLRRLLARGGSAELIYAGDRMWPAVRHGEKIRAQPLDKDVAPLPGEVVLACPLGIPDLLRVRDVEGDRVRLAGDADPAGPIEVSRDDVIARAGLPRRRVGAIRRTAARVLLDLREAWRGRTDAADPADTVRLKYDEQAPFYAGHQGSMVEESLLDELRRRVPAGGKILVAGSGTGRECVDFAEAGWYVSGVDFAPAMVDVARGEAERRGLDIRFHLADLRQHREPPGSLQAVVFTYDVYSFLSRSPDRIALLREMAGWLDAKGVIFLSARRAGGLYHRGILWVQFAASLARGGATWGHSHTRWVGPDGALRRSFVQVFPERRVRREIDAAGLAMLAWPPGHAILERR